MDGSVADPDLGSGMNNPDHIFKSLETIFLFFWGVKIRKFFDEDPGSKIRDPGSKIRDPGLRQFGSGKEKKSDLGSGINILDPQH